MENKEKTKSLNSTSTDSSYKYHSNVCSDSLLQSISYTLLKLITDNKSKKNYNEKIKLQLKNSFTCKHLISISISDYLARIKKYAKIDEATMVCSLILMDKYLKKASILLTEHNVHQIIFISILLSLKLNEDYIYSNKYYAKIGGIDLDKLNKLEINFINELNFNTYIDNNLYIKYYTNLLSLENDNN